MRKTSLLTMGVIILGVYGCLGYRQPTLDSKKDIEWLDKQTQWIRGRGLSDSELQELQKIMGACYIDFTGGMAAIPLEITDSGLQILSEVYLPNVQVISIGYNNHITDDGVAHLRKMHIRELYLVACQSITDEGIRVLAEMPNLQILHIEGCPGITDQGLKYLSDSKSLWLLRFGRANIEPKVLKQVEEINNVDLSKENQISVEGLKQLSQCKSLRTIIIVSERPELISEQAKKEILTYFEGTGIEIKLENYSKLWKEKGGAIF